VSDRRRFGDPYAGIPGRRLFVAVPLPDEAAGAVASIVDGVRAMPLPAGMRDVRWVRLDGLHLTLRFLGPTPDDRIEATVGAVRSAAARIEPFGLRIAGAGSYPPGPRPRTLWLGVHDQDGSMARLATAIGEALDAVGWSPDARPFRPHLTLARSDGLAAGPVVAERLAAAIGDASIETGIEHIGVFESLTGGGPARYLPVDLVALGQGAPQPPEGPSVYHRG
jgi:2'-5' RNA ligase